MSINAIEEYVVDKQVGSKASSQARRLCRWLYGDAISYTYRVAPSPIARSEAELFGVSTPRFAFRKYIRTNPAPAPGDESECCSFINLRRLGWLHQSIRRRGIGLNADDLEKALARNAVADSLIIPPSKYNDYYFLGCDLWHAYGESRSSPRAVPFLQHMALGGGMCAQAAIFMVLCLLEDYVTRIPGIAEITALTACLDPQGAKTSQDAAFAVHTDGLKPRPMVEFLIKYCDLSVFHEAIPTLEGDLSGTEGAALDGYIHSGFPVICLVDQSRLSGDSLPPESPSLPARVIRLLRRLLSIEAPRSIYHRNDLFGSYLHSPDRPKPVDSPHAVVMVGASRKRPGEYVVNDPATVPLLKASFPELKQARNYDYKGFETRTLVRALGFISVLPKECRLPLIGLAYSPQQFGGLFSIASHLIGLERFQLPSGGVLPPLRRAWPGTVRLVDLSDTREPHTRSVLAAWIGESSGRQLYDRLLRIRQGQRFFWLHRLENRGTAYLFVWPTREFPSTMPVGIEQAVYDFLWAVYRIRSGKKTNSVLQIYPNPAAENP
jgi:hypothetical protein